MSVNPVKEKRLADISVGAEGICRKGIGTHSDLQSLLVFRYIFAHVQKFSLDEICAARRK